ncbi:DNRLRE domain-containing protein [Streptomyces sp. NPDC012693]|uniref:DNRLRE domain-containing protein n=1 Tax=unclassified Streptomyces TaxID=2593676 RepID=UPI002030BB5F|nr:DNRLRE domain-containing protein [Streptomyces sp. MSC1_001]
MALATAVLMAVEATFALGGTGQAMALPSQLPSPAQNTPHSTEAADLPSATVAARLSGKRVEALAERTESTTTWANPDGTATTESSSGPVRFRDKTAGTWRIVDINLTKSVDGSIVAKHHPLGLKLGGRTRGAQAARVMASGDAGEARTTAVPLVSLDAGDGKALELSWRGVLPEPALAGTTARYVNALTATDLIIESTRTGFEQFLELKDRSAIDANGSVTLTLNAKGVDARANADRSVTFLDTESGRQVGVLPAPVMWDAYVDPRSGEHTRRADVGLKVKQRGNAVDLTLTPDAAFLADPETKFPVTVDPAVNIGPSFDTVVQQGHTTDMSSSTELKLGNNGSGQIARSFLHFPMTQITGKQILSAKLNLWNSHSWSCTPASWEVWDTPHASTSSRWTTQPGWNSKWATSTATKGSSSSCADGWVSQDIKNLAAAWAANGNGSNAMGIRATTESDPYSWKRFNSGNAASNTPYVSVTYNTIPVAGNPMKTTPGRTSAGKNWVTTTTPDMTYTASDAETHFLRSKWELWEGSTNLDVYDSGTYDPVLNKTVSFQVPPGKLVNGRTYWFKGRVNDENAWSNWTPTMSFTVDTTKPAISVVSSSDYPANTWSGTAGTDGIFSGTFTFTPPTSDVASVEYKLDAATTWQSAATAGTAVSRTLSFPAGKHTVTSRTVDPAGNVSTLHTHTFYAGSGAALLTPGQGERPARRVGLSAEGLASYTGVTYQYRRGETDGWKNVPVADVRQGTDSVPVWPVAVTSGKAAGLTWNITDSLTEDGPIEVRAAFTDNTPTAPVYSPANDITVDRNAGTAPSQETGPGSVNLLTGDYLLSSADASLFGLSVSRAASSRRPDEGANQEGQAAIFGPQWTSGTIAETTGSNWSYVKKTSATSVALVDLNGEELGFTATTGGGWKSEPGAEDMTLSGSLTGSFTLKDTEGTRTVFAKPEATAIAWQVVSTSQDGLAQSTTAVTSEIVIAADGKKLARPKMTVSPTSAVSAATCTAYPSTKGCRALEFVYAVATTATGTSFGDFAGQVKEIRGWATDPGAAVASAKIVQKYSYDASGRLREAYNPLITPLLKTQYAYDAAGRVTTLTPPGELPWSFTYGRAGNAATAGDGMLLKVGRSSLQPGTKDVESGTASTSIVYDVPLTGARAPYAMGTGDVQAWGQTDAPTDATAVFPADAVPTSHSGAQLATGDYRRASVTYTDASGRQVNVATPGGHISAIEYDQFGNTVGELTAGNRALALGGTEADLSTLTDLGIVGLPAPDRADLLAARSVYDQTGTRAEESLGPLRRVAVNGESAAARSWTVNEYDAGRPTDGTAIIENQITKVTTGAQILGTASMADARATQTFYDWATGLSTKTVKNPAGLAITETTEYDAQGRVTKQLMPGATGADAATRVTTYWTAGGTGTCQGRPEWADRVCSTGPAGLITGGGSNPAELPTTTSEYDWWGNTAKVSQTANGVSRVSTNTVDAAGRPVKSVMTGGLGQAVPESTTEYDPATGRAFRTTSPSGGSIVKEFDKLGRQFSYTDADGGVTRTEYDLLNRPVKVSDSVPSTVTYAYDSGAEPRGLVTTTTDSVAGAFHATYDADGSVSTEKLPGGYTLKVEEDTTGTTLSRVYTRDSDGQVVYSDTADESVHGQVVRHSGWSSQSYSYDAVGRLTHVNDFVGDACTKRTYGFDKRTNRSSLTATEGVAGMPCPTTEGTATTHSYDSADRLVDTGYVYDAFGRATALPGSQIGYYSNDLVHQQTANGQRQTWQLDAAQRFRSWTVEENVDGTWTQTAAKVNHYDGDGDSPRWIAESAVDGTISRNVPSASGGFAATTGNTGNTVLHLTSTHGDVALQLPLNAADAPVVLDNDEYGNPRTGQPAARYNWLGGKQRSTETVTGLVLMGVRLYNPQTGRFLSGDPVFGGNANAYEYCAGDPVNCTDLNGMFSIDGLLPEATVCALYFWRCGGMMAITWWAIEKAKIYRDRAKQNAFRHCIWQAMLTWSYGVGVASSLARAHERGAGRTSSARIDVAVDYYNNVYGRQVGNQITAWTPAGAQRAACSRCSKLITQHKLKSNKTGGFL